MTRTRYCMALLLGLLGCAAVAQGAAVTNNKADYELGVESSMVRVMPDATLPSSPASPQVRLALARGEYESFQILLRPTATLRRVRLTISDLTCKTAKTSLSASHIQWHQVGYVQVLDTRDKGPAPVPWLEPGWYPDPLLPVRHFDVAPNFTQPVWVTIYAPVGTPAGIYTGAVTIRADGQQDRSVPLRVEVYGFTIAPGAGHLRTAFALVDTNVRRLYGGDEAMVRRYRDYVLDELRLNPWDIWSETPPPLDALERLRPKGINAFPVCYLKSDTKTTQWPFAPSPEGVKEQLAALAPDIARLREHGLLPLGYIFGGDEVPREPAERIAQVKAAFALVKEAYPDIPLMTTAHIPQDVASLRSFHLDALCPMWDWSEFGRCEALRQAGLKIWSYISLQPYPPFPNWRLDNRLMEARTIFWQVYHQRFDAFLYWGLNIWNGPRNDKLIDPEAGPFLEWNITTEPGGHDLGWLHGAGRMLYAGKDGPIGSIRLANLRDGLEDYEYLWLLARRTGSVETAREMCKPVGYDLDKATQSPGTLYRRREEIARRIVSNP